MRYLTPAMNMQLPKVMAPAGSFASMSAAINAGCDAIYFGVTQLNMRARSAHNFTLEDLPEIGKLAAKHKIQSYIALNTLLYEHDLNLMRKIISTAKDSGISAVIVADVAAMQYAKEIGFPVQASTQLSISNIEAVKFYAQFVDTVVLARELDLKMIKNICQQIVEQDIRGTSGELLKVEIFVHGALCIAQSGRCQMSLLQNNTSAQRGACLQECRKKYRVIDDETGKEMVIDNEYVLSPKDLCSVDFLDQIVDTGVSILKIEGRGRSPEYVDVTVRAYREALDAIADGTYSNKKISEWRQSLNKVYNRGFTDGYFLGKKLPDWSGEPGNQATEERVFVGLVTHHFPKAGVAEIKVQAHALKIGDKLSINGDLTGVVYQEITSIRDEEEMTEVKHPATVTIPVSEKVRKNDKVYLLVKRNINAEA